MLVDTGEQIMELLLIGGIVLVGAILLLVIVFLLRKRAKEDRDSDSNE